MAGSSSVVGRLRDATGPRERGAGRVVDGDPRAPLVFGQRGVQRVKQLGGGGGVARRRTNEIGLAGGAAGNRREIVRARIESLLDFRLTRAIASASDAPNRTRSSARPPAATASAATMPAPTIRPSADDFSTIKTAYNAERQVKGTCRHLLVPL